MTKPPKKYETGIREPRWQQVLSVLIVAGFVGLWLLLMFMSHS